MVLHQHTTGQLKIEKKTALMYAAENSNIKLLKRLLQKKIAKAIINMVDSKSMSALMYAAKSVNGYECAKHLVCEHKANIGLRNTKSDMNAMLISGESGNLPVLKLLLENGADINSTDNDDNDVLITAASKGHLEVCKFLLEEKKYPVDCKNDKGRHALMVAAMKGRESVCEYLLEMNCPIELTDEEGKDAIFLAGLNYHNKIVLLLENYF